MDPNTAYERLKQAVYDLDVTGGAEEDVVNRVVDAWRNLTAWLERGGFSPAVWSEAQRATLEGTRPARWEPTLAGTEVPCPPEYVDPFANEVGTSAYDDPAVRRAIHELTHTNPWDGEQLTREETRTLWEA